MKLQKVVTSNDDCFVLLPSELKVIEVDAPTQGSYLFVGTMVSSKMSIPTVYIEVEKGQERVELYVRNLTETITRVFENTELGVFIPITNETKKKTKGVK